MSFKILSLYYLPTQRLESVNVRFYNLYLCDYPSVFDFFCGEQFFKVNHSYSHGIYKHKVSSDLIVKEILFKSRYRSDLFRLSVENETFIQAYVHMSNPTCVPRIVSLVKTCRGYLLVMDRVRGWNLDHYIKRFNVSLFDKLKICRTVARKVSELHDLDIVHRDLKLENVMIRSDCSDVCIIDFGYSAFENVPFLAHRTIPSSIYVADEDYHRPNIVQVVRKTVDSFSLGVIFLELITEVNYMSSVDEKKKMLQIKHNNDLKTQARIRNLFKKYSPSKDKQLNQQLMTLIFSMMRVDPNDRTSPKWAYDSFTRILSDRYGFI